MSLATSLFDAPLLKAGVLHAKVDGGTYVELGERSFFISGDKLSPIVSRLLDSFDGTRAVDEIRQSLPEKLLPLFNQLLDQLVRQRMLTSGPPDAIAADHPHAPTLHFLRDATSRWRECFDDWTRARITLAGSPELVPMLARAIASTGAGDVAIADEAAAAAVQRPDERRSLLLYLGAQAPDDETLVRIDVLAERHDVAILAAVSGGIGLVGPDCRAGSAPWRRLMARTPSSDQPFTRAAVNVLASLLAFEALQERIAAWSDDPDEAARRATQFRVVRNDGTVSSHDSEIFLASGRTIGAGAPEEVLVAPADPALTRFFDPSAGVFADAAVPGPEYPLAHRAVTLHYASADGEAREELLYDWGTDPDDAERRLSAQAFATLAARRLAHEPSPGVSPLIASASPDDARARAVAYAVATLPTFLRDHPPRAGAITPADGADGQALARLAHLYTGALPAIWNAGSVTAGACVAWAQIADWTVAAIAPTDDAAVLEALGEALSAFQLGRLTERQTIWPLDAIRHVPLSDAADSAGDVASTATHDVAYVTVNEAFLPAGIHVGYARASGA